jgi:hypothetical protein
MTDIKNLLPIGSVVLLKNGAKKLMITGVLQKSLQDDEQVFDYIGVLYPEGYINPEMQFLFNQENITDVIYKGYENPEREELLVKLEDALQESTKKAKE